jgi:catechol 2,3-dioxygenase
MNIVESQTGVRSAPLIPNSTRFGAVHLAVTDRARALAMWRDVIGLELLSEEGNALKLGVDGKVMIVLETGARAPVVQKTIGLYHVAIHVPTRADLAQLAARAIRARVRISPTDHLVSEAIYLWDLDGNGIEITFETPWRGRLGDPEQGAYAVTTEGKKHSGREPIDLDDLFGELGEAPVLQARMPKGTRIGHVHVHVNDLEESMRFYRDGLGYGGLFIIRQFGMGDVGLNYPPHSLAFNIWSGEDAKLPPAGSAGLRFFEIFVESNQVLEGMKARLDGLRVGHQPIEGGFEVADPSGNRMRVLVG